MNIRLNQHSEQLIKQQLSHGEFRSPEEVIERALETLAERESRHFTLGPGTRDREEAVADILKLRKGVTLGGLKIKNLIHEGHRI